MHPAVYCLVAAVLTMQLESFDGAFSVLDNHSSLVLSLCPPLAFERLAYLTTSEVIFKAVLRSLHHVCHNPCTQNKPCL